MNRERLILCFLVVLTVASVSRAESGVIEKTNDTDSIWQRETLTNGFFGLGDKLADSGIEIGLGVTNIYQQNAHGGISTHRRAGRFAGNDTDGDALVLGVRAQMNF
jgi:hypothetical protein